MRMVVLGAGQQGSACAYDLLVHTDHDVVLADLDTGRVAPFLQSFLGGRLKLERVDGSDPAAVRRLMDGAAATMSALPFYLNAHLTAAAIEAGSHFCDLGGNTEIVLEQKALHGRARAAGVSIVPDCGVAPGMVNILAEHGIRRLQRPRSVRMMVGGLPQNPEPPLNYQVVYSLEGVLDYYTTLSWVLRDGRPVQVEALSDLEVLEFPGVGTLEAFHTAGGLSLMAQRYEGTIDTMEYKTLRYPGHAAAIRVIRDLGLLADEPVEVEGQAVSPRSFFIAVAGPRLRRDPLHSPDLVALRVEVEGEVDGESVLLRWDLLDKLDPEVGITAMMRTTGYSLAVTAVDQATGKVEPGVWTPDEAIDAERYIAALADRGVRIHHERIPASRR
jgi:lysine 6-dehydrogenase